MWHLLIRTSSTPPKKGFFFKGKKVYGSLKKLGCWHQSIELTLSLLKR